MKRSIEQTPKVLLKPAFPRKSADVVVHLRHPPMIFSEDLATSVKLQRTVKRSAPSRVPTFASGLDRVALRV
jgi:hypothetical protein